VRVSTHAEHVQPNHSIVVSFQKMWFGPAAQSASNLAPRQCMRKLSCTSIMQTRSARWRATQTASCCATSRLAVQRLLPRSRPCPLSAPAMVPASTPRRHSPSHFDPAHRSLTLSKCLHALVNTGPCPAGPPDIVSQSKSRSRLTSVIRRVHADL